LLPQNVFVQKVSGAWVKTGMNSINKIKVNMIKNTEYRIFILLSACIIFFTQKRKEKMDYTIQIQSVVSNNKSSKIVLRRVGVD
jgi:hypothetical protein